MLDDPLTQFRVALSARSLIPDHIDCDGRLHRCLVEGGRPGRLDGAYLLHLDDRPAGGFQNHRDGLGWQDWRANAEVPELTAQQRWAERTRFEAIRRERQADELQRHTDAARRAASLWGRGILADADHPYLRRKGVLSYEIRQINDQLMIPLRNAEHALVSLQFISVTGDKKFLTGGRKCGCYFGIGRPSGTLCLVEGYATGASVHAATGHAVAVCFDAGNLEPVARMLRIRFPQTPFIVAADNDTMTPGNPGLSAALRAAKAADARVAVPCFDGVGQ